MNKEIEFVVCPRCGTKIYVSRESYLSGKIVDCPKCKYKLKSRLIKK